VNGGRLVLFNSVATALAIFVIVFGLAAALGGLGSAAHIPTFEGKLIGELAARLPITLEPVLISFLIASALGFVLTLPSAPVFRAAVAVIVTGLQSLPLFVLAIAAVILLPMYFRVPLGSWNCVAPCTFGQRLEFLIVPVAVLTIYQLPFLAEFFNRPRARGQDVKVGEISTVGGLAVLFAHRLPSLVSAAMIGELFYGWAGEGRWLGLSRDASAFTLFLIFNALVVLVIRCLIESFVQPRRTMTDVDG
jgi:ABC-type dipeptide/oligopeptide/nickel transport system permease component